MTTISTKAIDLILESEGIDQPEKWPGGGSGITLGYGCDIGADPKSLEYWRGVLSDGDLATLAQARGITGRAAAQIRTRFANIHVTEAQARTVFTQHTLPTEIALTLRTFPGVEKLPNDVLGALTSLVFNRGGDLTGDRRREMQAIHDAIVNSRTEAGEDDSTRMRNLQHFIAEQLRGMKRLWVGQGLDGLLRRRDAEAALAEAA